jgi:hypothetical protein
LEALPQRRRQEAKSTRLFPNSRRQCLFTSLAAATPTLLNTPANTLAAVLPASVAGDFAREILMLRIILMLGLASFVAVTLGGTLYFSADALVAAPLF